jgi:PAP2 superfamily
MNACVSIRRHLAAAALVIAAASFAAPAAADDAVLHWNEIAQQTVAEAIPLSQSRSMAIAQTALLNAATAADAEGAAASVDAAVMTAAHDSLAVLVPDKAAALDQALAADLATVKDGAPKDRGIAIGRDAAAAILGTRKEDGAAATVAYEPKGQPGSWQLTPPKFAPAMGVQWGKVTPFVIQSADQFRPPAPADLNSADYLKELRDVQEIGAANSSKRPPEKTDAAKFWVQSGSQGWSAAARQASLERKHTLLENAQNIALLNVAIADALIACWDAKYTYELWRPVTALQAGVGDIPPAADWQPLIATPPHPSYPSGHACGAGAALTVLDRLYGPDGHKITLTSSAAPGVSFNYASFREIADQIDDARVYGGIHTRQDQAAGRALGQAVAGYVLEKMGGTLP